jgi:protein-S-isoprenylcysteine O-methyltransferase Ste14
MPANHLPPPLFELKGRASVIDLSAWLSGLSYLAGVALIGPTRIALAIKDGGFELLLLPLAYVVFIASVLIIQRHMRLSLRASTFGQPKHLVTSGVFRYSRNPIYVAFFLPLASLAIISPAAAIASLGIYICTMNLTIIRQEERELAEMFGAEFETYMADVPRWVV